MFLYIYILIIRGYVRTLRLLVEPYDFGYNKKEEKNICGLLLLTYSWLKKFEAKVLLSLF